MGNLYLENKQDQYRIPEEIVLKYNIKAGDISPFTKMKVISESMDEQNIDIKKVGSVDGNTIDIKKVSKTEEIDIKKVSR